MAKEEGVYDSDEGQGLKALQNGTMREAISWSPRAYTWIASCGPNGALLSF
jgi:hypothetical protein